MKSTVFLVLGMHRSGTSALARALNLGGLTISDDLILADSNNPSGYWESKRIVALNERLLDAHNRFWADPKPMSFLTDSKVSYGRAVQDLLEAEFGELDNIIIKDPRISRLMPAWRQGIKGGGAEPICLIACRNPLEISGSLQVRDKISAEHALALWQSYMLEAELGTRGLRRAVISYDALLKDSRSALRSAFQSIGLGQVLSLNDVDGVNSFLNVGHRNHNFTQEALQSDESVRDDIKLIYQLMLSKDGLEDTETFDSIRARWLKDWETVDESDSESKFVHAMPDWHHHRGILSAQKGKLREAEASQRKAIQLDGTKPDFYVALGDVLNQQGDCQGAITCMRKTIELKPSDPKLHYHLAELYVNNQKWEDAEKAIHKTIEIDDAEPKYHNFLADILKQKDDLEHAIIAVRQGIEANPHDAGLHGRLGKMLLAEGKAGDAETVFKRAVELKGHDASHLIALGNICLEREDISGAINYTEKAIELSPGDSTLHNHLGNLLALVEDWEAAFEAQSAAIDIDEGIGAYHMSMSNVLNKQGETEAAIEAAKRAVMLTPEDANYHQHYGTLLWVVGRLEEAEIELRLANALDPDVPAAHIALSHVYHQRRKLTDAIASARRAVELRPENASYQHHFGILLATDGQLLKAAEAQREATVHDDKISAYPYILSDVLGQLDNVEEAIIFAKKAIQMRPQEASYYHHYGNLLMQDNQLEAAAEAQRQAITLAGDVAVFPYILSDILSKLGDDEGAIEHARKAVELAPKEASYRYHLGNMLDNGGQFHEATEAHRRAMDLDGEEPVYKIALDEILGRLNVLAS